MTVRFFSSTDSGHPVLSGTIGSLIALLDACLVNGYGSKAGAGWSKAFTGTNLAAYRQASSGAFLRIDDAAATVARCVGYDTMSDVNTGTNDFPSSVQKPGGMYVYKSNSGDATERPWVLAASERTIYLYIGHADTVLAGASVAYRHLYAFGDITSYKAGDAYNRFIMANETSAVGSGHSAAVSSGLAVTPGHYMQRSHTQLGSSITVGKHMDGFMMTTSSSIAIGNQLSVPIPFPDPVTGGMLLSPISIHETAAGVRRGVLPGLWAPLHIMPGACGDTFTGTGTLAGKTFMLLNGCHFNAGSNIAGRLALEISDTW